jgi:hypothetical protein
VAVGASWRRSALLVLLVLTLVALAVALVGAGPLGPGALAALLLMTGAPVLAAGVLAGAGALAGAVGGLLAGPGGPAASGGAGRPRTCDRAIMSRLL